MSYAVGSLVKARGREWVVLPESTDELLIVRPLGGMEEEVTGIYVPLESVQAAQFALPDPNRPGDYRSARMLRDAVRLGFRSSAGPFRSFARLGVEPRPYQLVPLLMALKLDPVRLLIADDVGIGKTIETALIVRELLDRGEITRLAVLCSPQLAEQWQVELQSKFHLEAELVLPSTATRLERNTRVGESLFDLYPFVIVSTDFIKSDRRRAEFLRTCPECVIVDEAHTCVSGFEGRGARHQRHQLVAGLSADANRHLILVTATPHSGNEGAFRSLLELLNPAFRQFPEDLSGPEHVTYRRQLAAQFIQRRRPDIRAYLDTRTPFPDRQELPEQGYRLTSAYRQLVEKVLHYARETVTDPGGSHYRQRVRWWSALALLRSVASSPAAAAATLRSRAAAADTETADEADEVGRHTVLDLLEDDAAENIDVTPGSDIGALAEDEPRQRRRLLEMAREAEALQGTGDTKLQSAISLVETLLKDGFQPILFCRFIHTAEYVKDALRQKLPRDVTVAAVTGTLPPAEREARVLGLGQAPKRVLVCTDCLSEGINLQEHFNAVIHYDLSWNPTRHEQREGRVDRYGQPSPTVRVVTLYGLDNQIDGIVLDVLLRKHKLIRNRLGISVPVPVDTSQVVEAIFEGLLLREQQGNSVQPHLPGFEEALRPQTEALYGEWEATEDRERRSRTMFAQETIKVDEVARELHAIQEAVGSGVDIADFTREALRAHGATISGTVPLQCDLSEVPQALRDALGGPPLRLKACFELPVRDGETYLSRTHPLVEGLATYVMDTALDPLGGGVAQRAGVIRSQQIQERTTLLLLRFRYHIVTVQHGRERLLLAEDCQLVAFRGAPAHARWLDRQEAEALLETTPEMNVPLEVAREYLSRVVNEFALVQPQLNVLAEQRGQELLEAHRRVRTAARLRGISQRVEIQLPPDVLGIFIYLPPPLGGR